MVEDGSEAMREFVSDRSGQIITDILLSDLIDPTIVDNFSNLVLNEGLNVGVIGLRSPVFDAAFHLHAGKSEDGSGFAVTPFFAIDLERGLMASDEEFMSELARAILVAGQYPDHGYERSMREVYGEALLGQKKFLDARGIGPVKNDPRRKDHDDLIYELFPARYFHDPSFEMYVRALGRTIPTTSGEALARNAIRDDKEFFVRARELVSCQIFDPLNKSLYDREDRDRTSGDAAAIIAGQAMMLRSAGMLA